MLGSLDDYFDIADKLQALGQPFTLLVKHPNGDGILALCNVDRVDVAGHMMASMRRTMESRFTNPDGEDDPEEGDQWPDDPSNGPGI